MGSDARNEGDVDMVGDDELADLALAADVDTPVGPDAVSLYDLARPDGPELLPAWYMPPPAGGRPRLRGWRRAVVLIVVLAFLVIEAAGLCSTYGQVVMAGS